MVSASRLAALQEKWGLLWGWGGSARGGGKGLEAKLRCSLWLRSLTRILKQGECWYPSSLGLGVTYLGHLSHPL